MSLIKVALTPLTKGLGGIAVGGIAGAAIGANTGNGEHKVRRGIIGGVLGAVAGGNASLLHDATKLKDGSLGERFGQARKNMKDQITKHAGMFDVAAKAGSKLMGNNILRNAAIGAGAGAVAGAANAGEGNRLSGALKGGALGGAVGGATTMGTNMYKGMKAQPNLRLGQAASSEIRGIGLAGRAAQTEWKTGIEALKPAAQGAKPKPKPKADATSGPLTEQVSKLGPVPVFDPKAGAPSSSTTSGWHGWHNPLKSNL